MPVRDKNGKRVGGAGQQRAAKARKVNEAARKKARAAGAPEPGPGPNASCPDCKRAFPHLQPDPWDDIPAPDLDRPELSLLWANRLATVTLFRAVKDPFLTDEEKYRRVADFLAKMGMVRDKVKTQGLVEELEKARSKATDKSGGTEAPKPGTWKKSAARSAAGAPRASAADPVSGPGTAAGAKEDG